jgi:hypothetical protein
LKLFCLILNNKGKRMKKMLIALFAIASVTSSSLFSGCCNDNCCPPVCERHYVITKTAPVKNVITEQYVCPTDCATPNAVVQGQRVVQG